jgi:hypothetical protein
MLSSNISAVGGVEYSLTFIAQIVEECVINLLIH